MKIKSLSILLLSFLAFACARPNYNNNQPDPKDDAQRGPATVNETRFMHSALSVNMYWEHKPQETNEGGEFTLQFHSPDDPTQLIDPPGDWNVILWMPSMNHGSRPVTITRKSAGEYWISNVYFIMRGPWQIRIQLKDGDAVTDEVIKDLRF
jgi:hypothetical protein